MATISVYALETTDEARRGVYAASLAEPNGRRLVADPSSALFVPTGPGLYQGRLLFVREQALMAQAFDATSLQLSGDPVTVAEQVSFTVTQSQIAASVGMNGTLAYLTDSRPDRQLCAVRTCSGKEAGRAALLGQGSGVSLAPHGKRVAFLRWDGQRCTRALGAGPRAEPGDTPRHAAAQSFSPRVLFGRPIASASRFASLVREWTRYTSRV